MKHQKFIFHSKTVISAILTLLISVCPLLLRGINEGFSEALTGEIIAILVTSILTIRSRYHAQGTLYTPRGLPGRDYVPAWKNEQ